MFGISLPELMTILAVALLFLKPAEIQSVCKKLLELRKLIKQELLTLDTLHKLKFTDKTNISLNVSAKKKKEKKF
mgnify:CR=1 FL=1|jgi:Sec-independent protein translocase protein TatA